MLVQGFIMANFARNTKPFFWKSEAKLETLQKLSPYIGVLYKFILKQACHKPKPNLPNHGIFVQAFLMQIWSKNRKPFSWDNEAKLKTFQKRSLYIGTFYKVISKSVKSLN